MGNGQAVGVFEFAAHRDAMRDAGNDLAPGLDNVGIVTVDVVRVMALTAGHDGVGAREGGQGPSARVAEADVRVQAIGVLGRQDVLDGGFTGRMPYPAMSVLVYLPFGRRSMWNRIGDRELPEWAAEFDAHTWAQFMLKFVVAHPAVSVACPGTGDPSCWF